MSGFRPACVDGGWHVFQLIQSLWEGSDTIWSSQPARVFVNPEVIIT